MWTEITYGFLNALWIIGVWNAFLPGMVFGWLGDQLAGNSKVNPPIEGSCPEWFTKPLFACPMCMASYHGVLWWGIFHHVSLAVLPVYIVCLSGFLKIVSILVLDKDS